MLSDFKALVISDPPKAHARLVRLFSRLKTRGAVAAELRVGCNTLDRHIAHLARLGFDDPRAAAERAGATGLRKYGLTPIPPELGVKIRKLRGKHLTIDQVAQQLGISPAAVSRHTRKAG